MKKQVLILLVMALAFASCGTKTATNSLAQQQQSSLQIPRYKMFETTNFHILLKADTRTGQVWMTQYALGDTQAAEIDIPGSKQVEEKESWNGRFDLFPTQNMFNFILLDTHTGTTWQVQWSTDPESRLTAPITQ